MIRSAGFASAAGLTLGWEALVLAIEQALVPAIEPQPTLAVVLWLVAAATFLPIFRALQTRNTVWLWPVVCSGPLVLLGAALLDYRDLAVPIGPQLAGVSLSAMAEVGRAAIGFLWVGGLRRSGARRLWSYVPAVVLWGQLTLLGLSTLVVPGVMAYVVWALLPVVAARHEDAWLGRSVRGIHQAVEAWVLVALVLPLASTFLYLATLATAVDDPETLVTALLAGTEPWSLPARLARMTATGVLEGGVLAFASSRYDAAVAARPRA